MAKRNRRLTPEKLAKWLKEGRGQGRGKDYKPVITIYDIASIGLSSRDYSAITGRVHHLLSRLELYYYLILNWIPGIVDIREQFPLDIADTLTIAEYLGIRHPYIIGTRPRFPYLMTTDFLVTKNVGGKEIHFARDIKYASSLKSKRTLQKLAIAKCYWTLRKVNYGVLTQFQISKTFAMNVDLIRRYTNIDYRVSLAPDRLASVAGYLTSHVLECELQLRYITDDSDGYFNMEEGTSLTVAYHLIANRLWNVDMSVEINPACILQLVDAELMEGVV